MFCKKNYFDLGTTFTFLVVAQHVFWVPNPFSGGYETQISNYVDQRSESCPSGVLPATLCFFSRHIILLATH